MFLFTLYKNQNTKKSILLQSEKFIEKSEFFDLFDKILFEKNKLNQLNDLGYLQTLLRQMIELIIAHAYLSTCKDSVTLNEQYKLTRLNTKNSNNKKQSYIQCAKDKNLLPEFLELYDIFSQGQHSTNDPKVKLDNAELIGYIDRAFHLIVNYMQGNSVPIDK